jgi:hypothetical protein
MDVYLKFFYGKNINQLTKTLTIYKIKKTDIDKQKMKSKLINCQA